MLVPSLTKNDQKANWLIGIFSVVVFSAVVLLSRFKLELNLGFDVHIFATINAFINSAIALLLIAALVAVKNGKYLLHKRFMMTALVLSILFLVSYIAHHLLAGEGVLFYSGNTYFSGSHHSSFYSFYGLQRLNRGICHTQKTGKNYLAFVVVCSGYRTGSILYDQSLLSLIIPINSFIKKAQHGKLLCFFSSQLV